MAEIIIKCPHCGASMSLEEEYLGMEFQCPVCNQQFIAERADDDSYNIMNDEKETGREADGVSIEQEIGLTPQTQSPAENTAGEQDLPTESVAPETRGDGDGSAESAKDKLGNLFSGAKGKLGNLYANAKEKLTDDNAQALAANAKDKLGTLFTRAKGKLGDLYVAAKEKMDEASSVEENTDPVNAGEPEEVVRKEYDEDNLPEPDPGSVDPSFFGKKEGMSKSTKLIVGCICTVLACIILTLFFRGMDSSPSGRNQALFTGVVLGLVFGGFVFMFLFLRPKEKIISTRKRDLVREYFEADVSDEDEKRAQIYDEVRDMDVEYLKKLNVLARFGKNKQQLVAPMQTLFSPAFAGVEDLRQFQSVTSENDGVYRYNLEKVTKVYTFEDQLFIYTGVWAYALGKMISEKTTAFFFKDITDMRTESEFRIYKRRREREPKGCLFLFFPSQLISSTETVYKESESFVVTSASGNSIGLNIGFEDAVRVTGATYTSRNDNEKIVHAIRKMIEEKKVAADA